MTRTPPRLGASDPYAPFYARARRERALAVRAAFAAAGRALARLVRPAAAAPRLRAKAVAA